MQADILSSFLHSPSWLEHVNGTYDLRGNVWQRKQLPKNIGQYLFSNRVFADHMYTLPPHDKKIWFYRLQADSGVSHQGILQAAGNFEVREVPNIQPRQTLVLDLNKSEEQLLTEMNSKHRYNIRLAQRHGVTIRIESKNLRDHLDKFLDLLSATAQRQNFRTHTVKHYTSLAKVFEKSGNAHLVFAEHQGKTVAALLLITYEGVGTYLHGASDYNFRSLRAPLLMQWEAIRFCKTLGCSQYDFWGINAVAKDGEYKEIEGHSSSGTTHFKLGFGGRVITYPPTIDIILSPFWYSLYSTANRLRSRKRSFS